MTTNTALEEAAKIISFARTATYMVDERDRQTAKALQDAGLLQSPSLLMAREALEPFAHTGWMLTETEHTPLTIVAHIHASPRHELKLSSGDFRRAREAYKALGGK
jgi:hypothetical protein